MLRSTRRRFCEQVTVVGLGGWGALTTSCRRRTEVALEAGHDAAAPSLVTFSSESYATLSAACERILPRDEDPGAIDLGVPRYIDRMVATPELASVRALLMRVLPLLDRESKKRFGGKAFHEASPPEQDEVLTLWERGHDGPQPFFPVLLSLTLEGAFGDPKYGGNIGGRGYAMVAGTAVPSPMKMGPLGMPGGSDP